MLDGSKVPYKVLPIADAMFDENAGSKQKRKEERQKKKALQSNMMQFITKEYRYLLSILTQKSAKCPKKIFRSEPQKANWMKRN